MPTKFTVRIENISKPDAFTAPNGVKWSLGFSPGVVVVHTDNRPIFTGAKKDRGQGLEHNPRTAIQAMLAKSLQGGTGIKSIAVVNTPIGASVPGPITPGAAYEFTISAMPVDRLCILSPLPDI